MIRDSANGWTLRRPASRCPRARGCGEAGALLSSGSGSGEAVLQRRLSQPLGQEICNAANYCGEARALQRSRWSPTLRPRRRKRPSIPQRQIAAQKLLLPTPTAQWCQLPTAEGVVASSEGGSSKAVRAPDGCTYSEDDAAPCPSTLRTPRLTPAAFLAQGRQHASIQANIFVPLEGASD